MKSADFLDLIVTAHVIVGVRQLQISGENGQVNEIAAKFVDTFVTVGNDVSTKDEVFLYACDVITLGLVWKAYYDACREGDGERIMVGVVINLQDKPTMGEVWGVAPRPPPIIFKLMSQELQQGNPHNFA